MPGPPLVISHRTNMGTMPENTLAGIEAAIADGADGIEIDVRATRDHEVVLMHDATLERTTGDRRALASLTLEELRTVLVRPLHAYQSAEPIPTLREALSAVAQRVLLTIELKETGLEGAVASLVRELGATPWCWCMSFIPEACRAMRGAAAELPVLLLVNPGSMQRYSFEDPIARAIEDGLAGISPHHSMVDDTLVRRAHEAGLRVFTWTVNQRDDIDRVRDAGVDAICGDVPTAIAARLGR